MIDLKKNRLPETVEVDGSLYPIHTSFKYWLRFLELIDDKKTSPLDFDFIYSTDKKPKNKINGFLALIQFCNPPQKIPKTDRKEQGEKILDYEIDSDYIYSAFFELYGIDLVKSDMHWYKFQALFRGLHGTKLNEIIGYRLYENTSGKKDEYTRQMENLKVSWSLPESENEVDEDLIEFEKLLNTSKKSSI
ncbi:Gp15 family bacteriophage protein [Treponema pectinovorum]|uniref:Gp15 family bacteriophage protein n=1 Tax=Treponema pectinovorum TaxID=164 RepID=UPI0011C87A99|nr:Gp15 family bacteriophage protein [Treponema pectinovorum]